MPHPRKTSKQPMATVKAFSICRLSSFGDAHKSQIVLICKGFWPLGNLSSCRQFSVYSWQQTLQLCGPLKAKWRSTHTHTYTEMYKNISINNGTWYISGRAHKALCAREREKENDKKWAISIKWRMEERQAGGKEEIQSRLKQTK